MKRKGFTLVELLAVIAILAILVIIALPNVIKLFNNAKKNTFLTEVKSLYNSASAKYISESLKGNKLSEINSNDSSKLDLNGNLVYKIKLDSNGKIKSVAAKKGNYCIITNKESSEIEINDVKEDCDGFSVLANWYDECKDKNTLRCKMLSDNKAYNDSVKSEFVASNSGINFKEISSDTNGKGLYYSLDSDVTDENNDGLTNRIYYYRGDINNNFVVLGDKCYKILRTTENGNVKLMYHDEAKSDGTCSENVKYKESAELLGGQAENQVRYNYGALDVTYGGYMIGDTKLVPFQISQYTSVGLLDNKKEYFFYKNYEYKDGKFYLNGDKIKGNYFNLCKPGKCSINNYYTCLESSAPDENICKEGVLQVYNSYLKVITVLNTNISKGSNDYYFSDSYEYKDGKFKQTGNIITTENVKISDLCNSTSCKIKGYYTLLDDDWIYKVIEADGEMLLLEGQIYGTTDKSSSLSNKKNSAIKDVVDEWYKKNIEDKNLSSKIADEIYCNDRSQLTIDKESFINDYIKENKDNIIKEVNEETLSEFGYTLDEFLILIANEAYLEEVGVIEERDNFGDILISYSILYRIGKDNNDTKKIEKYIKDVSKPTYKCKNKNDRFTTSNLGNGKLKYPTAIITLDEIVYAGASVDTKNTNYIGYNIGSFWTMTPVLYNVDVQHGLYVGVVGNNGTLQTVLPNNNTVNLDDGLMKRAIPVISLKSDVEITGGIGTANKPYIVKIN